LYSCTNNAGRIACCLLQSGVAVFRVVEKEEEAAASMPAADDPGSTTRLVIPEDAISSRMIR
jgi:hypothetical protein